MPGDAGTIRLLIVGKIALADLDAVKMLRDEDLIEGPRSMPLRAAKPRYLLSRLADSTFLDEIS